MGSCFSSESFAKNDNSCANVVSLSGDLRQYSVPFRVSQVLELESVGANTASSVFLCNSDSLSFDDYIPKLGQDDYLQPAQIYFVLPVSKLNYKLSGSDMAALAVKASVALQSHNKSTRHSNSKARISPVFVTAEESNPQPPAQSSNKNSIPSHQIARSGSMKKLQRFSSRRVKFAVRSFKIRLNTIYEGSVLILS